MFKNKGVKTTKKQVVVKPKVVNPSIHIVDVNMAITKSKVIEEHVFKDKKPIKKSITSWKDEQKLQQSFVKTIYEMQVEDPLEIRIKRRKHNGVQVGHDYQRLRCPQNKLYHKVCLLFLII